MSEKVGAFICRSCNKITDETPSPLWECSRDDCGETFVEEDRTCPSCNRPFSRKLALYGCEDCQEEMEEVEAFRCKNEDCEYGLHETEEEALKCEKENK